MVVTEQSATDLLETLGMVISRARRTRVFHVVLGALILAVGIVLIAASHFSPPGNPSGTPVTNEVLFLGGLIILGVGFFIAKRVVELGDRLHYKRETVKVVEAIMEYDPQVRTPFNREVILAIYEGILYE